MKKNYYFLLGLIFLTITLSCKKDPTRTELLTNKNWKLTACAIDPALNVGGTLISDFYAQMAACDKDDIYNYKDNGTMTRDEGPLRCNGNDPQTYMGVWAFSSDNSTLTVTITYGTTPVTQSHTILELTKTISRTKYTQNVDLGSGLLNYTFTNTYTAQ